MAMIVAAVAGSATATYVGTTLAYGAVAGAVAGAIVVGIIGKTFADPPPSLSDFGAGGNRDFLLTKRATNAAIPIVYGTRRVGGTIVFIATYLNFLALNVVLAEGEIEGITTIYLDGALSTHSKFTGLISGANYNGTATQAGDATLASWFTYYSTTAHRLAGTAYMSIRLKYNPEAFPSGTPAINALVKGTKIYDPRNTLTAYSTNPALCVRDYLTNERYGRGITTDSIDDASFIASANYCDELITVAGDNIKRYVCNGAVNTLDSSIDILKKMLTCCRGFLVFSGGKYKLMIDKPELPSFTFSEDNITGGWNITLGGKTSQFNSIKANFFNASKDYQEDVATVKSDGLKTLDGGIILEHTLDLPFTTDITRATILAVIILNQSRQNITCSFTATIEGLKAEVGDVVYIKHDTPGWTPLNSGQGKKFRVVSILLKNNEEVVITASEYADEVYDFGTITVLDPAPNTALVPISATEEYVDVSVTEPKIANNAISSTKIVNEAVSFAKMAKGTPGYFMGFAPDGSAFELNLADSGVISGLQDSISDNTSEISNNTSEISNNTSLISNNTSEISNNTSLISDNTSEIGNNTSEISSLADVVSGLGSIDNEIIDAVNNNAGQIDSISGDISDIVAILSDHDGRLSDIESNCCD